MEDWVLWTIAAVALAVGEIFTLGFFLAPFAGGAAAAAVVSATGLGLPFSLVAFLAVSTVLLLGLRPIARAQLKRPSSLRTGTAALIGRGATVEQLIDDDHGMIRLDGDMWTARPFIEGERYEPGTRVSVIEIRGATALVSD